jgi:two-component system chemotaxis response regulator CheB
MIVDDSAVARQMVTRVLHTANDIEIVTTANNGEVAIAALRSHAVDVILLDVEMPVMDGITALPKLLEIAPRSKIIMVSSLTREGAEVTIKALGKGAVDCMSKPSAQSMANSLEYFGQELLRKIRGVSTTVVEPVAPLTSSPTLASTSTSSIVLRPHKFIAPPKILAIGSSTGGPLALAELFRQLQGIFTANIPIVITQHMPAFFTSVLAQHLARVSDMPCHEATQGQILEPRNIYIAPGDFHLTFEKVGQQVAVRLTQSDPVNFCRPAVDPMYESLIDVYGGEKILGLILTGMGQDGLHGAEKIVEKGGSIIAQDQKTSVVWGMPGVVATKGLCSAVLPLPEIGAYVAKICGGRS